MLKDSYLSDKARGLLCRMLSYRDDWQFYESELIKGSSDGRRSIHAAILELIEKGYIKRTLIEDKGKERHFEYKIRETVDRPFTEKDKPNE